MAKKSGLWLPGLFGAIADWEVSNIADGMPPTSTAVLDVRVRFHRRSTLTKIQGVWYGEKSTGH